MKKFPSPSVIIIFLFISLNLPAQLQVEKKSGKTEYVITFNDLVSKFEINNDDNSIAINKDEETFKKSALTITGVNIQDSLALVDLYNSTNGGGWTENYNWLSDKNVSYWKGIEVENGRVTLIDLENNGLTGTIPSSIGNLTALKSLNLSGNNLTGNIPPEIGNLVNLEGDIKQDGMLTYIYDEALDLSGNNLSGSIPSQIGNLVKIKGLRLNNNNLSGNIPSQLSNLQKLFYLRLQSNKLTGNIPPELGSINKLITLDLANNQLTGEIPGNLGSIDSLMAFSGANNKLAGEIPSAFFISGNMKMLAINNNNLGGSLPASMSANSLGYLGLSSNQFTNLPAVNTDSLPYGLGTTVLLDSNRFDFSDLEQFASKNINNFKYAPQDTLLIEKTIKNQQTVLSFDAGGTQTVYQWFYNKEKINGATGKTYSPELAYDIDKYHCEATNDLLPELILTGKVVPEGSDCWSTGELKFCLNSGNWEKIEGEDKIFTTNVISINDFLYFNGSITIDTLLLKVDASGEFFINNIPLPGGEFGKFSLMQGDFSLTLLGNEGIITYYLNSKLTQTASLFGAPLKIDNIQFIRRQDTIGVNIGCSVNIPRLSVGCGIIPEGTGIALKNLQITNSGISLGGFDVENLGFIKEGYCLKKLTYDYNSSKDILVGGMDLSLPFFADVGGGFKIEKGNIDSLAWSIEGGSDAAVKVLPIGIGTMGVKGFYGHIAGLNQPVKLFEPDIIDIKMGGTFSDILSDDLYQLKGDGRTIWPKIFEVTGTVKLLKPPISELPFQLSGEAKMTYDISNKQASLQYTGKLGFLNENTWLMDATGDITIDHRESPSKFSGNFGGEMTLPKLSNSWPFSWIETFAPFPWTFATTNTVFPDNLYLLHGILYFYPWGTKPWEINYIIDISKYWYESGYIRFPGKDEREIFVSVDFQEKSGKTANSIFKTFTIPENTDFAAIEIRNPEGAPESVLSRPDGTQYQSSASENGVLKKMSKYYRQHFWSILEPEKGDWTISLENTGANDTIITYFQEKKKEFNFSADQTENIVNITWNPAEADSGQIVKIMFDTDMEGFNGFLAAECEASQGNLNIYLDERFPGCYYYVHARLTDEYNKIESYSPNVIYNPLTSLAPPDNFNAVYDIENNLFKFSWDLNTSTDIQGYILSVTDEPGNDSVYAIVNSSQDTITLYIENFETKTATIESFNQFWETGCPSGAIQLSTNIQNLKQSEQHKNFLDVFPNPTSGTCIIRYFVRNSSKCMIKIFDLNGRLIAQPLNEYRTAGSHQIEFQYQNLPNGIYFIHFSNHYQKLTVKSVLNKNIRW